MPTELRQGYFVLADISGYTAFLTGNELEHANGIVEDLVRCVVRQFSVPWRLVKLEGDAAFFIGTAAAFADAERVVEAIEKCYFAFSDLRDDIARATTCTCSACSNIATLDLKFIAHFGEYVPHRSGNAEDVAGRDVIVAHRLLKNRVREATGFEAYALLTDSLVDRMLKRPLLPEHDEECEGVGTVHGHVEELRALRAEYVASRRIRVDPNEADFTFSYIVPAPPEVTWQYWTEATKRLRWSADPTSSEDANERGRTGVGSSYHCAHGRGSSLSRYVDWRPCEYFSTEKSVLKFSLVTPPPMLDTCSFERVGPSETRVTYAFRVHDRGRASRAKVKLMAPVLRKMFARDRDRLVAAVIEDAQPIRGDAAESSMPEPATASVG